MVRGESERKNVRWEESLNRDALIEKYAPTIRYIAQRIASRLPSHVEPDDLINAGVIGLMDAIDKFDPSRGIKFVTYAEFRIRGAMLDELRNVDWVPRSVRQKVNKLEKAYLALEQRLGRLPEEEEVAAELGMDLEDFHDVINRMGSASVLSIEDFGIEKGSDDKRGLLNLLPDNSESGPFERLKLMELKKVLVDAVNELSEQERLVVSLYHYEELTMKEIGEVLEITESRVSQIRSQAMIKLRVKLKKAGYGGGDDL